jgi:hypothetical protein
VSDLAVDHQPVLTSINMRRSRVAALEMQTGGSNDARQTLQRCAGIRRPDVTSDYRIAGPGAAHAAQFHCGSRLPVIVERRTESASRTCVSRDDPVQPAKAADETRYANANQIAARISNQAIDRTGVRIHPAVPQLFGRFQAARLAVHCHLQVSMLHYFWSCLVRYVLGQERHTTSAQRDRMVADTVLSEGLFAALVKHRWDIEGMNALFV